MSVKKPGKRDQFRPETFRLIIGIFYYGMLVVGLAIKIAIEMIFEGIFKRS